jgi:hypothetical protein
MLKTGWIQIATSLIAGLAFACPANAAKPAIDIFSAGSPSKAATSSPSPSFAAASQGSFPGNSNSDSQAVKWFEKFDEVVFAHKATEADRGILTRGFNQEAERVQEWTDTAEKLIKRYRELTKILRAMPVPGMLPGVKEYRDLTADWYSDAADVYAELIKPRPPAKTIEELQSGLDAIKTRAHTLYENNTNLRAMDMSLRKTYRVHLARTTDALQQYVRSK